MAIPLSTFYPLPRLVPSFSSHRLLLSPSSFSPSWLDSNSVPSLHSTRRLSSRKRVLAVVMSLSTPEDRTVQGVSVYKPESYDVMVGDAAKSLMYALDDGKVRLEIDFPPLPSSLVGYKGTSDDLIDANIQLAMALSNKLNKEKGLICQLVLPDKPEKRRALRIFKSALEFSNGVRFGCLDDIPGAEKGFFAIIRNVLDLDFTEDVKGLAATWSWTLI